MALNKHTHKHTHIYKSLHKHTINIHIHDTLTHTNMYFSHLLEMALK